MTFSSRALVNGVVGLWAPIPETASYYVKSALLIIILVVALVAAYRVWEEIHDVEEPDSPDDLLESFEQAHAAGVLNDQEFDRVRQQFHGDSTSEGKADQRSDPLRENPLEGIPTGGDTGPSAPAADDESRTAL
jgi:hypothetical protein